MARSSVYGDAKRPYQGAKNKEMQAIVNISQAERMAPVAENFNQENGLSCFYYFVIRVCGN
jgi:hypothetical protein